MIKDRRCHLWIVLLCLFILTIPAAGCAKDKKSESYGKDGYLGKTLSNPNLATNPTYNTYAVDRELVEDVLADYKQIQRPKLLFGGTKITIYYSAPKHFTTNEIRDLEAEVLAALERMIPRYDFELKSNVRGASLRTK